MVKRLSFLCVLINLAAFASELDSPRGMVDFYRTPPLVIATVPVESSNELDRAIIELISSDEYNDPENDPICYISSLFDNRLIDQEELVSETKNITSYFQTALAVANAEIKALMPDDINLEAAFDQCFTLLNGWYSYVLNGRFSDNKKFMARNALQTLALLNGDTTVSRHSVSSVESYSCFKYLGLPNAKQLFVFACKLSDTGNPRKFILSYLAENFSDSSKWQLWKKPFESFFPGVLTYNDLGLAIAADEESGGKFIGAMAEFLSFGESLPCAIANSADLRIMSNLFNSYIGYSLEKINSITEALFMARRGHNIALFDAFEQNKPACAEGLYLNLLRETAAMLTGGEILINFTLDRCA